MKKFLCKLFLSALIVGAAFVCKIGARILQAYPRVSAVYDLSNDVRDVFIGSSQIGCGIFVSSNYHNTAIWMSSVGPHFSQMNLQELERRNRLKNVRRVVVAFNVVNYAHLRMENIGLGIVRSFPVSWRYLSDLPLTLFQKIKFIIKYRHQTFAIGEIAPDRPSILMHDKAWIDGTPEREGWDKSIFFPKMYTDHLSWCENWSHALEDPFYEMDKICKKNAIEFVVLLPPLPLCCKRKLPTEAIEMYDSFVARLKRDGFNVIDARDDMPEECFADYWHLTKEGAKLFTSRLYKNYFE